MKENHLLIAGAAVFFFFHLICENISSFIKYNFSSIGRHMQGVSWANIFAVVSRGFVALYGLLVAYVIERQDIKVEIYSLYLSISLLCGAWVSLFLSRLSVNDFGSSDGLSAKAIFSYKRSFDEVVYENIRINVALRIFIGIQFVAVAVAYGVCIKFPQNRLFIVSLVPVISMIGTIVTVVFVEPRLAKCIDSSSSYGHMVSREFMRARAISFLFSFFVIVVLNVSLEMT